MQMAADMKQSLSHERELASIICCNSLVLMTLTAKDLWSRSHRVAHLRHGNKTSSFDSDIIQSFLKNAKRALKIIDYLVSPCLINVQALLSLVRFLPREPFPNYGKSVLVALLTDGNIEVYSSKGAFFNRSLRDTARSGRPLREV